ncbi:ABC transporter permease [Salipiger thiooxidans]|uniref:ABC transporter permease n=1 Tax=Salipiger thiooxidans TaxID=282683 RepID=UPI001CD469A0|nr:ABC transporter permease [Salipiger thiooxidans]MCA0848004.1 ABC transporter permease [Salipiger thiooxidans]
MTETTATRPRRLPAALRQWNIAVGALILGIVVLAAILAPWIAPYDPFKMASGPRLTGPTAAHWFGTDELGRDLFSRVLLGARLSLGIGFAAVAVGLLFGVTFGMIIAFCPERVKALLLRIVDVVYSFPDTLLALALVAFMGPGVENATIAIAISLIPFYARVTYGFAAVERAKPYVEAAQIAQAAPARIMRIQVLPNILQSLIVIGSIGFSSAILSAAGLSFLGLGVQPPSPEWGSILASGRNYISRAPWILIFPGLAICLTVLSFNLIGDGIRDLTDPKSRRRRS